MSAAQDWVAHFRAIGPGLPGAGVDWLDRRRGEAIARFAGQGWPTARRDVWRHTSLASLAGRVFAAAPATGEDAARAAVAALGGLPRDEDADRLVFVDGRFCAALSSVGPLPDGVRIEPLSRTIASDAANLEPLFGSADDGEIPAALNLALAADGAFVRVPPGVELTRPVLMVFVAATPGLASFTRNLVSAGAAARLALAEHHVGDGTGGLADTVTRIDAEAGARIEHLTLQCASDDAVILCSVDARQAQRTRLDLHALSLGAGLARHEVASRLAGEGGEVLLNGLYHVDGARHVDHHTRIDHDRPGCTSREYYRGILDGRARGVFCGRIVVAPGAARTDALQRTDSLLLSPAAEADARPELEIYADDVKCAHGATVGRIDEDALFYLRSRGLGEASARDLLVWAFAASALERIAHASLRRQARAALIARLPGVAHAGGALEALA